MTVEQLVLVRQPLPDLEGKMTSRDDERRRALGLPTVAEAAAAEEAKAKKARDWQNAAPAREALIANFRGTIEPWVNQEFVECQNLAPAKGFTVEQVSVKDITGDNLVVLQYQLSRNVPRSEPNRTLAALRIDLRPDEKVYGYVTKAGVNIFTAKQVGEPIDTFSVKHVQKLFDDLLKEARA